MKLDEVLKKGAQELGVELDENQVRLFLDYLVLLKLWNTKINLTAIEDDEEIVINHFVDSLSALPFIAQNSKILDIGSGAGFPGIPLRIASPSLEITLIDSVEKKAFFMREAIRKLGLNNIQAYADRAGDKDNGIPRNHFDCVISRAVGSIKSLLELSAPYLGQSGRIVLMRGKSGLAEWDEIKNKVADKFKLVEFKEFRLPIEGQERTILAVAPDTYAAQ